MLVRRRSLLGRVCMCIPLWVPFVRIDYARVGADHDSFMAVTLQRRNLTGRTMSARVRRAYVLYTWGDGPDAVFTDLDLAKHHAQLECTELLTWYYDERYSYWDTTAGVARIQCTTLMEAS